MKIEKTVNKVKFFSLIAVSIIIFKSAEVYAQMPTLHVAVTEAADTSEDYTWWYIMLFMLVVGLVGAVYWRLHIKKQSASSKNNSASSKNNSAKKAAAKNDKGSVNSNDEMDWYRKNHQAINGRRSAGTTVLNGKKSMQNRIVDADSPPKAEKEKLPEELPVFSLLQIQPSRPFAPLPISNDKALMNAIEQAHEESEEDDEIRELTVKVLKAFKNRNSVEALSEIALYDLSSNLRSKAVTILSEFDHESVFETIVLACADPSREVKAAAARSLFRLSFDRANAWTRILESDEEGRVRQIARASIEADLVERSLERLVHEDHNIAQEAAAFAALMIKSGETEKVFEQLVKNKKNIVRKAILHVIKITKDQKALEKLYSLLEENNLPLGLQEDIDKTIEEMGFVTV